MTDLPHDPTAGHTGFERELADSSVEYLVFIIDQGSDARAIVPQLEALRKRATELYQNLAKNYIWQRDEFSLEPKNEGGLWYLHGVTEYGDAVEDEWLIVYMIRQLSRSQPNVWARVLDTDGEFLLVEAANVLPRWLSPEIDRNRVWLHNGRLYLIPSKGEGETASRNISLQDAVEFIKTRSGDLVHSTLIEEEAFYRLEKYPAQVEDSIHYSLVTIPRKLAYVLHTLPKTVSPAVEAFYIRDAKALQPIMSPSSTLTFPPEDLVTVSVRFSKVLFAQLRSQHFDRPPRWQSVFPNDEKVSPETGDEISAATQRLETGMKLTCGFEILAASAEKSKSRVVREMAIVLEDLLEDGDEALPSDAEIRTWPNADRNDNEAWMDINYEDFERELGGKREGPEKSRDGGFGDAKAQDNLRKIVSRFENFLNDDSAGVDGAEMDEMDFDDDDDDDDTDDDGDSAEDREVSFDEDEFARMMREMMGLPPKTPPPKQTIQNPAIKEKSHAQRNDDDIEEGADSEDEEIRRLTTQMEAELKEHDALRLEPKKGKQRAIEEKGAQSSRGQDDEGVDEDSEEQVDVDYNLAKNILESFKSQGGMAGPTGNLLGMMGLNLPRDEDDNQNAGAGPSSRN